MFSDKRQWSFKDFFEVARLVEVWKRQQETGIFIVSYSQTQEVGEGQDKPGKHKKIGKKHIFEYNEPTFIPVAHSIRTTNLFEKLNRDVQIFVWDRLLEAIASRRVFEPECDEKEAYTKFVVHINNKIFNNPKSDSIKKEIEKIRKFTASF